MIFVFIEDGTLDIVENLQEARKNYESIDVESGVYEFFDAQGVRLQPVFTVPNKYSKWLFGLFKTMESGVYNLETSKEATGDSFLTMLEETIALNPNKWFSSLEEIKSKYVANT